MFIMHLSVVSPTGKNKSGTGPVMPPLVQEKMPLDNPAGTFAPGRHYFIACDPDMVPDGSVHRHTHAHPPSVSCRKCKETEIYKSLAAAYAAGQSPHDEAVVELPDGCC